MLTGSPTKHFRHVYGGGAGQKPQILYSFLLFNISLLAFLVLSFLPPFY